MCVELCMENGSPIGGDDIEVEIDETKIGKWYLFIIYYFTYI